MKKVMTAAGIVLSGLLLWLALKDTDFDEVFASFRNANGLLAAPLLLGLASFYALKAARWSDILSSTSRIRVRDLVPSMMSGAAGNNLLPAHMGELVRAYLLGREYGLSKIAILASLVAERVFDIVGVLLLLSITLLFADVSGGLRPAVVLLLIVALAGLIFMYLMVRHTDALQRVIQGEPGRYLPAIRRKLSAYSRQIALGLGAIRESRISVRILVSSTALWMLMSACIYCALQAFAIDVPYHAAIVVLAIIVAGLTLPTSPGFVGTIQYCFVLGLAPFGVEPSKALAASIFYHSLLWLSVTSTGLYCLHRQRLTLADIRELERRESLRPERSQPEWRN